MSKRQIIKIDEDKCNGCGICVKGCPEGAIQMIDGKARLVSEIYCDGLGACIGDCPQGAIEVEEREAQEYDERKTMENIVKKGENTIKAHLKHLLHHGEVVYYKEALKYLRENNIPIPDLIEKQEGSNFQCPSTQAKVLNKDKNDSSRSGEINNELNTWPVQLKLVSPMAGYFNDADLLITADCVPMAYADFHNRFLKGKVPVVLCPKLDNSTENYIEKLAMIFSNNNIKSISIVRMEVPCCGGTSYIVEEALKKSGKNIIIREYIIGINGEIK